MRNLICIVGIGTLAALSACTSEVAMEPPSTNPIEDDAADAVNQIESILDTYDQAISEFDLDLFLTLLADPDGVSFVTPGGRLRSLADLEAFFQGLRDAYSELVLTFSNVAISIDGSTAWATFDWTLEATMADGQEIQFDGWETQLYRHTDTGWGIVHVHYSVPAAPPPENP